MPKRAIIVLSTEWELSDAVDNREEAVQNILRILERDTPEFTITAKRTRIAVQEIEP